MNTCQLCHCDHLNNHSTAYCSDCLKIVNNHPAAAGIVLACNFHEAIIETLKNVRDQAGSATLVSERITLLEKVGLWFFCENCEHIVFIAKDGGLLPNYYDAAEELPGYVAADGRLVCRRCKKE